jgi:hypothetical protein
MNTPAVVTAVAFIREAFSNSSAVRWSSVFFIGAAMMGLLPFLLGSPSALFVLAGWGGLSLIWSLVGYARGGLWARDPVIPTRGVPRSAGPEGAAIAGESRITSLTDAVEFPDSLRERLFAEVNRFKVASARILLSLEAVILAVGASVALVASQPLLMLGPAGIAVITAAVGLTLRSFIAHHRMDALRKASLMRTSGPMKLEWQATRFGRYWTIRIGDRTLHAWDAVGSRLANMPWCITTYTSLGRIIEVRALDGTLDYADPVAGPVA